MKKRDINTIQGDASLRARISGIISTLCRNFTFNCVILALLGLGIGLMSLLLGATIFGVPLFVSYFASPMVILLNILPPVILIFLFYFICGRSWIAFTFPALFILIISMIQFFKVQVRGDPLLLSDASLIFEVGTIMNAYTLTINWKIYLAIAVFVCGVVLSVFVLKLKLTNLPFRIAAAAAVIAVSAALYVFVYTDARIYAGTGMSGDTSTTEWTSNRNYISRGFLYPFIYSIKSTVADLKGRYPDWYNEQSARQLLESYDCADIPADKKVDIICMMLEAYSDLSRFGVLDFTTDVYGPLHRLQAQSVSGTLVTNVFAGATIDTERLFLTGYTRLSNYNSPTNSYVQYLRSQGYCTEGMHPGNVWYYDRRPVNKLLGFDNYYFIDDYADGNRTDSFFMGTVMELYKSRDASKPYFSFNLSIQNHGAYSSTRTKEPYVISQGGMSDESYNILNNYLSGICDTCQRVEDFINSLRGEQFPVVVIVFGDHMPWLGNQNSVYNELGINIDCDTEDGFNNYYSAPYFIWANDAAKKTLSNDFIGEGGSFSPCFLLEELFSLCSWEGDGYTQALREMRDTIDVINTPTGLFRENGTLTPVLSPSGEVAYKKLRMIEIYRLNNFDY